MIKIIGSVTSPYTRTTRVVCEELDIPYEFEMTVPFRQVNEKRDQFIGLHNPLLKVPILIDENIEILDSRIIVQYLLNFKKEKINISFRANFPENLQEENLMTVILGVTDAGILRFMLSVKHPEIDMNDGYMARCLERIERGLIWINNQENFGQTFGVTEAALICGLEWFQKRNIFDWKQYQNILQIYEKYCNRPSLIKTRISETV